MLRQLVSGLRAPGRRGLVEAVCPAASTSVPVARPYSAEAAEEEDDFEPSPAVVELADNICALNMLDAADLTRLLRKRFGLSAASAMGAMPMMGGMAPMAAAPAAAGAAPAAEEEVEEKTEFNVKLEGLDSPDKKIKVIKEVRALLPDLGLKEAKALVESAPADIKTGIPKDEAEALKKKLEEVGAKIAIV